MKIKINSPFRFCNHIKWLKNRNSAVCDGITEPIGIQSILYPIFILTGIGIIMIILTKYEWLIQKIKGK